MEQVNREESLDKKIQMRKSVRNLVVLILLFCVVAGFSFYIGRTFFETWPISGSSMEPTLHDADKVVLVKQEHYKTDDVVIFLVQNADSYLDTYNEKYLVKRIIAKGGDTVEIRYSAVDGAFHVYRNGEVVDESKINEPITRSYSEMPPTKVPEGKLFVLGDNRNNSSDSHHIGFFADENMVVGKVFFRYTSIGDCNFVK